MIDRCYVLNLDRRPDRMSAFVRDLPHDWPFATPQRFRAIDGHEQEPPAGWQHSRGAWGCLQSHRATIRQCIADQVDAVLILEDDVRFCDDFARHAVEFVEALPADWDMAYLGGNLRRFIDHPPEPISDRVLRAYTVFGTYAYVIRGSALAGILEALEPCTEHIDRWYGAMHLNTDWKVYVPDRWLCGHRGGVSDTGFKERSWADEKFYFVDPIDRVSEVRREPA